MNSIPSFSSNYYEILKLPSQSHNFSKDLALPHPKSQQSFSFNHSHQSVFPQNNNSSDSAPLIFSEKSDKIPINPMIPTLKKLKKRRNPLYKCEFPYCQKKFVSKSQLIRHEKSEKSHKKQIFHAVASKFLTANAPEQLIHDKELRELYKISPNIFLKLRKCLKNSKNPSIFQ